MSKRIMSVMPKSVYEKSVRVHTYANEKESLTNFLLDLHAYSSC